MSGKKGDYSAQWKKFFLIVGAFLALVFLLYFNFISSRRPAGAGAKPFPVRAISVAAEDVKLYDTVLGRVEGSQSVRVLAGADGFVTQVRKSRGDAVTEGETVIVLQDSGLLYELTEAEGFLSSARTDFAEAERKYFQNERLFEKKVISKDALDSSRSAYLKASSQLEAFEASYKKAKWNYDRLKIRSPAGGTIVEIFPDEGQEVRRGETVAKISGGGKNRVVAAVDSSIAKLTPRGAKVLLEYQTPDGKRSVPATVKGVGREADENSTTYSVEIEPEGDLGLLWHGEFVSLKLESGLLSGIVKVPVTALLYDGTKPFVFIAAGGVSRKIPLTGEPVWIDSDTAAIDAEIFPQGALIITEGNSRLSGGEEVVILTGR